MRYAPIIRSAIVAAAILNIVPIQAQEYIRYGSATTYNSSSARAAFPQSWGQYGYNQQHNPVFTVPSNAPSFLINGITTVSPLTGDEMRRVDVAAKYYPSDGRMAWATTAAQWVGNVVGVSMAQGIVFATTSRREIYALDAQSSLAIWRKELVGVAGMGQPLAQMIGGKLRVIVTSGDADFNGNNAIRAANLSEHDRGAEFTAIYCLDALTGSQVWRFDTKGNLRPTPLYLNGYLYVVSGDGFLYVLNASTGALVSSFANPGEGQVGLSSPNWHTTTDGRTLIYYGTLSPRNILAIDVTNPAAPAVAWTYSPPGAASNAPGDVSVAIDPATGLLVTSIFTNVGTSAAPIFDERALALNAATGAVVWSVFTGQGPTMDGFKSANPMINNGVVYMGNPLNATVQALDLLTGTILWSTPVPNSDPDRRTAPRAAPTLVNGKLIFPAAQHVFTFDAATGALLNDYHLPVSYVAYGLNQPVVIGNVVYISSVSGYVYAYPVSYITTQAAPAPGTPPALPLKTAEYYNSSNAPSSTSSFPSTWLAYAGGPSHNSYLSSGPNLSSKWSSSLLFGLSLTGTAQDEALFGKEIATQMTHFSFGVGSGVTPVKGILYSNAGNRAVTAHNATNGKLIWRFRTNNHNFGQPLVTSNAVIVAGGNVALNLGQYSNFIKKSPLTRVGTGYMYIHALDPKNGNEKWSFYSGQGTLSMTPLYYNGNLYWVDGQSQMWGISASTGQPIAPFMDVNGFPTLSLGGGFNSTSSANLYTDPTGRQLMVVGMAMPNRMVAVDLVAGSIAWTQPLSGFATYLTGFAAASPAVDQTNGLVISSAVVNVDNVLNTAQVMVFALNGATGDVVWTQAMDVGAVPAGFVAPTPMVTGNKVYVSNPTANQVVALDALTGAVAWKTAVASTGGNHSWAPPTLVGTTKLIVPVGGNLLTFDPTTGALLKTYVVGGGHTFNHVTVIGKTVYVGNSFGWVLGIPLSYVTG